MAEQAGGVEIPHDKIIQALSDRYAREMARLHQECAQLQAGLEVAVAERDEARQIANEYITKVNHARDE